MKAYSLLSLVSLVMEIVSLSCGQVTVWAQTQTGSQSIERKIDSIFAQWNQKNCPGCILGVSVNGNTIMSKGYGMANIEHDIPLQPETISESGSVAKQFTSAAVLLLASGGKIHLDSVLSCYLSELPWWGKIITVRQLMNHTSGIRDIHSLFAARGEASYSSDFTNDDALYLIKKQETLNFEPGTEYVYSNSGYILLPLLVERISGQPFARFCSDSLFQPLGLRNTSWRDDFRATVKRRALAYDQVRESEYKLNFPFSSIFGSGGLLTTVSDLLLWNQQFEHPDKRWRTMFDALQKPSSFKNGRVHNYGLGLSIGNYNGMTEIAHGGATAGYRTFLARYPEYKISIALLCNVSSVNTGVLTHQVVDVIKGNHNTTKGFTHTTSSSVELSEKYVGLYKQANNEFLLRITRKEKKILLQNPMNPTTQATVSLISPETFLFGDMRYTFVLDTVSSRVNMVIRNAKDTTQPQQIYQKVQEYQGNQQGFEGYTGKYYSSELDFHHTIILENGALFLQMRPPRKEKLTPTYPDAFVNDHVGYIRFIRNVQGQILSYGLTNGRAWNMKFSKVSQNNK